MSRAGTVAFRERTREAPRVSDEETFMDLHALAFEGRRRVGQAYQDVMLDRNPREALFQADATLVQIDNLARRQAAEAAGITFIDPNQLELPLADGCGPDGGAA